MSNPGNKGQRYRLSKVTFVSREGEAAKVVLECGHSYTTTPVWGTVEHLVERLREDVGKRRRCALCEKASREVKA